MLFRRFALPLAALMWISGCSTPASTPQSEAQVALEKVTAKDAPAYDAAFWSVWSDGLAELSGYDLEIPRYNQPRGGIAVTIFVTETFSNSARVKADPGKHSKTDEFPVMKLNLLKKYQTGIYDYSDMTSTFVALDSVNMRPPGAPTKVSFSSQEWCGHVYAQILFDNATVRHTSHSYFDGEADHQASLEYPLEGMSEDVLPQWARGMAGPVLDPGKSKTIQMLMSLAIAREMHLRPAWRPVTLSRSAGTTAIRTAAGQFEVETMVAETALGKRTFYVERAMPHRIVQWETSGGEKATLLKSARLPYWKMNRPGGEDALKQLGLAPRRPGTS
jgi:hypothetical protein